MKYYIKYKNKNYSIDHNDPNSEVNQYINDYIQNSDNNDRNLLIKYYKCLQNEDIINDNIREYIRRMCLLSRLREEHYNQINNNNNIEQRRNLTRELLKAIMLPESSTQHHCIPENFLMTLFPNNVEEEEEENYKYRWYRHNLFIGPPNTYRINDPENQIDTIFQNIILDKKINFKGFPSCVDFFKKYIEDPTIQNHQTNFKENFKKKWIALFNQYNSQNSNYYVVWEASKNKFSHLDYNDIQNLNSYNFKYQPINLIKVNH